MANAVLRNAECDGHIDSAGMPDNVFRRYLNAADQELSDVNSTAHPSGFQPSVTCSLRDNERHFLIRLDHPNEYWCRTVCRLVIFQDGSVRSMFSFGTAIIHYAMPEDFVAQEAVNRALADMLEEEMRELFPNSATVEELSKSWMRCRERIQERWEKNEKAGMGVKRLSNLLQYGRNRLAVAAPSTRLGVSAYVGVEEQDSGRFGSISSHQDKAFKAFYLTHQTLALHGKLSASEKFKILQGAGERHTLGMEAFGEVRLGYVQRAPYPLPIANAVAHDTPGSYTEFEVDATFENGDYGRLTASKTSSHARYLQILFEFTDRKLDMRIAWDRDKGGFAIERKGNEVRFTSPELMDELLAETLRFLLDVDPVWPDWLEAHFCKESIAAHPLLAGRPILPRHGRFLATILGEPYAKAQKAAERFSQQRAKKQIAVENIECNPDSFPDGAIFAKLGRRAKATGPDLREADVKRALIVRTISEPGAKRPKRILFPLDVFHGVKPFTAPNLLKLVPLGHPDAVRYLSDYSLGSEERDFFEAAFRISHDLPPMAANPLFAEGGGTLMMLETAEKSVSIRVTRFAGAGWGLDAYRVLRPRPDYPIPDASTGVAFVTTPAGEQTHALPSSMPDGDARFDDDISLLTSAITGTEAARAESLLRRLRIATSKAGLKAL